MTFDKFAGSRVIRGEIRQANYARRNELWQGFFSFFLSLSLSLFQIRPFRSGLSDWANSAKQRRVSGLRLIGPGLRRRTNRSRFMKPRRKINFSLRSYLPGFFGPTHFVRTSKNGGLMKALFPSSLQSHSSDFSRIF